MTYSQQFVVSLSNHDRSHFDELSVNGSDQWICYRDYDPGHLGPARLRGPENQIPITR